MIVYCNMVAFNPAHYYLMMKPNRTNGEKTRCIGKGANRQQCKRMTDDASGFCPTHIPKIPAEEVFVVPDYDGAAARIADAFHADEVVEEAKEEVVIKEEDDHDAKDDAKEEEEEDKPCALVFGADGAYRHVLGEDAPAGASQREKDLADTLNMLHARDAKKETKDKVGVLTAMFSGMTTAQPK